MTKRNRIVPYNNVAHQNPTIAAMSGDVSLTISRFTEERGEGLGKR